MVGSGRRGSRYDLGIAEHERTRADPGPETPLGPGTPPPTPPIAPPRAPREDPATNAGAQTLLATMQRDLDAALRAQMRAVEVALSAHTRTLDAQIEAIHAETARLQGETRSLLRRTDPTADPERDLEHLLDAIPEVPHLGASADASGDDLHAVLDQVRRQMGSTFEEGLARVEGSFSALTRDLEARLQAARSQLDAAREENERERADHERKAHVMRELKRALESI